MFRIDVTIARFKNRFPVLYDLSSGFISGLAVVWVLACLATVVGLSAMSGMLPTSWASLYLSYAYFLINSGYLLSGAMTAAALIVAAVTVGYVIRGVIQRYRRDEVVYHLVDVNTERDELYQIASNVTPENRLTVEFWNADWGTVTGSHLDTIEFARLSRTCKGLKILFQDKVDTYKLLKLAIDKADGSKVEELAVAQPKLIFQHVVWHEFPDENGVKRPQLINPLKAVVHVCDIHTLNRFEAIIQKHCSDQMPLFEQQIKTYKGRLSLQPLFAFYQALPALAQLSRLAKDDWNELVTNLSALQHSYLPMHIIKEISRGGDAWHGNTAFDLPEPPSDDCMLYTRSGDVSSPLQFGEKSNAAILMRGQRDIAKEYGKVGTSFLDRILSFGFTRDASALLDDFTSLQNLWKARQAQIDARIARCAPVRAAAGVTTVERKELAPPSAAPKQEKREDFVVPIDTNIFPEVPTHTPELIELPDSDDELERPVVVTLSQ